MKNIRLTARRGEVIALVGSSGAGKTTLVNLIPRFYELTSGSIRIDSVDIRDVTIKSLREQIAMVTQENILFHDTVWNNICYGLTSVPKERVEAAARAALADEFIMGLPQGYDTLLGERGTRLSGGQRQRIAIARALLKNPAVLVFDEATSNLDVETSEQFARTINQLKGTTTVLFIAHQAPRALAFDSVIRLGEKSAADEPNASSVVRPLALASRQPDSSEDQAAHVGSYNS